MVAATTTLARLSRRDVMRKRSLKVALRLAVEVDGTVHRGRMRAEYDEARSRALAHAGIGVVRIRNEQVSEAGLVRLLEPYVTASPSH